jgi:type VI secretion system protein ImpL
MNKFFKFLLFFFLFLIFIIILAGLGYWTLIIKSWPWWIFVVIIASFLGMAIGFFAIKKLLIRRNEKKFVQSIIKEEEAIAGKVRDTKEDDFREVHSQWKEAITKLKKSHLRKFGNPLYVLPWYILMGESRSGKTSAIKNSNLSSSLTDVSSDTIPSGTKHYDWWFLDQAIILDTAGRYSIPIEEERDKSEWQTFLTLLSKHRKKEPVNGVIVTVPSNELLHGDMTALSEKAKNIRQRINQLMRILGAKFPVYLLVTKMDLVNGFTDFCDHIPDQRNEQVMGFSNEDGNTNCMEVLEQCMSTIFSQLRELRSVFIQNRINNFAVSFPNEFIQLKPGLESYVQSLFGDDIYQAAPLFRGVYFSSACRQGSPESKFLKETEIQYENENSLDKNKGFFLRSFFNAILPKDRNVFTPLSEFLMWRKTTLSLGVFSVILLCLALSGILVFSYYNNYKVLNKFDNRFFKQMAVAAHNADNVLTIDRQRFEINKLQSDNENWILPRIGLDQSLVLEKSLKEKFIKDVKENLVDPMDNLFFQKVDKINRHTPYEDIVDCAVYAVRRIIVLKSSVGNDSLSGKREFEKSISNLFPKLKASMPAAIASKFAAIYYDYLEWGADEKQSIAKLELFQKHLAKIAEKTGDFQWLLSRSVCSTPDILISDFITGYTVNEPENNSELIVKGAFTEIGRNEISEFIKLIQKAYPGEDKFEKMEQAFWDWYAKEFYSGWFDFATGFPSGKEWQTLIDNWNDIATLMTTDHNPYFLLLGKMADEFESINTDDDMRPAWADTVILLKKIRYLAETETKKAKGSVLAKLAITKEKISNKIGKTSDKAYKVMDRQEAKAIDYNLALSGIWNDYTSGLKSISSATSYSEKCFLMFADFFKALSDQSKQDAPFNKTYDDLVRLKSFLKQKETSPVLVSLLQGPYDFLTVYGVHNTAKYLQSKWEEMILSTTYNIDSENYHSILFDRTNGVIWKFVNDEAAPFLDQSRTGFFSKTAFGLRLPFNKRFFKLLNKGKASSLEQQNEYAVIIQTAPMTVNNEAIIRPYSTKLTLECADTRTEFINNNFLETKKFLYNPATCGDVTLTIEFKDEILKKRYKGKLGFANFLMDFKDGTKVFSIADFPEQSGYLIKNNVTDINISYQINGIKPVLDFLTRGAPLIPDVIFTNFQSQKDKYPVAKEMLPEEYSVKPSDLLKDSYNITIETLPMGVSKTAKIKPETSILWMKCKDNVIRFTNNNYPDSVTFDWEPLNCGKVTLIIHFPNITLVKEYQSFFEFVEDFKYDSRTFTSDEFPEQKEALLKQDISSVTLSYIFKGDLPALGIQKKKSKVKRVDNAKNKKSLNSNILIDKQNLNHYTIHILMGPDREKIIEFIKENNMVDKCAIYKSKVNGNTKFNVIYGSFETFKQAQNEMVLLPGPVSKNSPWVRRFASINKEME